MWALVHYDAYLADPSRLPTQLSGEVRDGVTALGSEDRGLPEHAQHLAQASRQPAAPVPELATAAPARRG